MSLSQLAFVFIDVDGYCAGGVDQRNIISATADGYRARELGWAYFTEDDHGEGSIYFFDDNLYGRLESNDIYFARRLHGLPAEPARDTFQGEASMCASRLLEAFKIVHDAVVMFTGCRVVIVHKGGNEGVWASQALPGIQIIDLGLYGCPRVDDIARGNPAMYIGLHCQHHSASRRRGGKRTHRGVVHCPRLEVKILAWWVAHSV